MPRRASLPPQAGGPYGLSPWPARVPSLARPPGPEARAAEAAGTEAAMGQPYGTARSPQAPSRPCAAAGACAVATAPTPRPRQPGLRPWRPRPAVGAGATAASPSGTGHRHQPAGTAAGVLCGTQHYRLALAAGPPALAAGLAVCGSAACVPAASSAPGLPPGRARPRPRLPGLWPWRPAGPGGQAGEVRLLGSSRALALWARAAGSAGQGWHRHR